MDKAEIIRKGEAAKLLLEHPDFIFALEMVRVQAFTDWANSEPADKEGREEKYYLLQAIAKVKENLQIFADSAYKEKFDAQRRNSTNKQ